MRLGLIRGAGCCGSILSASSASGSPAIESTGANLKKQNADRIAKEKGMEGMIGYNETAARRSWEQMQIFFDEIFGRQK